MKYIKRFDESSNYIVSVCYEHGIENYNINRDGSIDVDGDIIFFSRNLTKLPLRFNEVSGDFRCSSNKLTSLKGSPKKVGGYFSCASNELTSLEGSPESVMGIFLCESNNITSVRGFPEDYEGELWIVGNPVDEIFDLFKLKIGSWGGLTEKAKLNTKIAHLLNEYDVISLDGKKVYRDNLEEVFHVLSSSIEEMPYDIKLKNYEIH